MWLCTTISVGRSSSARNAWNARIDLLEVVGVRDGGHVPAVRDEPRGHVLGEREIRMPLDRDPVRVVDPTQVRQPLVRGVRSRLRRDPLHHAAVPRLGVHVEVEEREAVPVVPRAEPLARESHADRCCDALAERPGGGLDAARPAVLGMARALGTELAKPLQVVECDRGLAEDLVLGVDRADTGQVEQRPEEGGGVARRQHEAVAVRPDRVGRIEAEEPLPERVRDGRDPDRRSGMSRARCLDRIDAQRPDRVDARLIEVSRALGSRQPRVPPSSVVAGELVGRRRAPMCRARSTSTGGGESMSGWTTRHVSSTASWRAKWLESPFIAASRRTSYGVGPSPPMLANSMSSWTERSASSVGILRLHAHARTRPRPDAQHELVRLGTRRVPRDEAEPGRRVEDDANLRHRHGERLARADEERDAGPTPVVDLEPQRAERLRLRVRRDAFDVEVAAVLAAHVAARDPPRPSRRRRRACGC